jgi:hypothetical protein
MNFLNCSKEQLTCENVEELTHNEANLVCGGTEFSDWCAEKVGWLVGRSSAIMHYWNNPPSSALGRGI